MVCGERERGKNLVSELRGMDSVEGFVWVKGVRFKRLPIVCTLIDLSTTRIDGRRNDSKEILADATVHFAQSPFVRKQCCERKKVSLDGVSRLVSVHSQNRNSLTRKCARPGNYYARPSTHRSSGNRRWTTEYLLSFPLSTVFRSNEWNVAIVS